MSVYSAFQFLLQGSAAIILTVTLIPDATLAQTRCQTSIGGPDMPRPGEIPTMNANNGAPPPLTSGKNMSCSPSGENKSFRLAGVVSIGEGVRKSIHQKKISSTKDDVSAIYAFDKAEVVLDALDVTTSGNASSFENASFHGLNAGVLAARGASVMMKGGTITTTGAAANGAFAVDKGSRIALNGVKVKASGENAHGVMVAGSGVAIIENGDMSTTGSRSAVIATDRGGGEVTVRGGNYNTAGKTSPVLYSTGAIRVSDIKGTAEAAEAIVVEGSNSASVSNSTLHSGRNGVMLYQSFSGDAKGIDGKLTIDWGSMSVESGPLFYITNSRADIRLTRVKLSGKSGDLITASADRWGLNGRNGGKVGVVAVDQKLLGRVTADDISDISLRLEGKSSFIGATKGNVSISIASGSSWTVTGDSHVEKLDVGGNLLERVLSKGHIVTYSTKLNQWAQGREILLRDGGKLIPQMY